MFKKGAGIHVDWAISMGIFIISIITLILLLRPGVKPLFDTKTLLNLVEDKFNNETIWRVKMIPLHVMKLDSQYKEDAPPPKLSVNVRGGSWGFTKVVDPNSKGKILLASFAYGIAGRNFDTTCSIATCSTVSSQRSDYFFELYSAQGKVNDPEPLFELKCTPKDKTKCDGYLGSAEEVEGYNLNWINRIINDQKTSVEYDQLKINWGYPSVSDFAIYVQGAGLDQDIVKNPEIPEQADVQAKLIRSWILKDDGSKENITISFRVW